MIRSLIVSILLCTCIVSGTRAADSVVLLDGSIIAGRVISQNEKGVSITVSPGDITMTIPLARVNRIRTATGEVVVNEKPAPPKPDASAAKPAAGAKPKVSGKGVIALADPGGETTANNPRYGNTELWPEYLETAKSLYAHETWEKSHVLVPARPGSSEWGRGLEVNNIANWTEDGMPAAVTPNKAVDVWFPSSETPVKYNLKGAFNVRHLTVGKNCTVEGIAEIWGNCWVMEGGRTGGWVLMWKGAKNTFHRKDAKLTYLGEDSEDSKNFGKDIKEWPVICHYVECVKEKNASVEIIGEISNGDAWRVWGGNFIIGPRSSVFTGRNNNVAINAECAITLLSGARLSKWENNLKDPDYVFHGTLNAGLPERPLIADCFVEPSYKNTDGIIPGERADLKFGFFLDKMGKITITSAKPSEARLCFRWHGHRHYKFMTNWGEHRVAGNTLQAWKDGMTKTPHRPGLLLLGEVKGLDGIHFMDCFNVSVADSAAIGSWRNVFVNDHPTTAKDSLFTPFDIATKLPRWRGEGVP